MGFKDSAGVFLLVAHGTEVVVHVVLHLVWCLKHIVSPALQIDVLRTVGTYFVAVCFSLHLASPTAYADRCGSLCCNNTLSELMRTMCWSWCRTLRTFASASLVPSLSLRQLEWLSSVFSCCVPYQMVWQGFVTTRISCNLGCALSPYMLNLFCYLRAVQSVPARCTHLYFMRIEYTFSSTHHLIRYTTRQHHHPCSYPVYLVRNRFISRIRRERLLPSRLKCLKRVVHACTTGSQTAIGMVV